MRKVLVKTEKQSDVIKNVLPNKKEIQKQDVVSINVYPVKQDIQKQIDVFNFIMHHPYANDQSPTNNRLRTGRLLFQLGRYIAKRTMPT